MLQLSLPDEIISSPEQCRNKDIVLKSNISMPSLGRSRSLTLESVTAATQAVVSKFARVPPLLKSLVSGASSNNQENIRSNTSSSQGTSSTNDDEEENLLESLAPSGIRHHTQLPTIMIMTPTDTNTRRSKSRSLNPLDD